MYLRSTPRRNKDGTEVRYLQLAHNVWDPQKRRSAVQVVYNFGREDAANREALQRLAASVTRFLDPDAALAASADGLEFTESGRWAAPGCWTPCGSGSGSGRRCAGLLKGRRRDETAERVLFALVANRALAPSSKLAAARWVSRGRSWSTGLSGDQRRCLLPGDGLAGRDRGRPGAQGVLQPSRTC